jgi:hypothetical protein
LLRLEQGQKITASIDYAFNPDNFRHRTKQNHIPPNNRHSHTLADFGAQLVEQRIPSNRMDLRADLRRKLTARVGLSCAM